MSDKKIKLKFSTKDGRISFGYVCHSDKGSVLQHKQTGLFLGSCNAFDGILVEKKRAIRFEELEVFYLQRTDCIPEGFAFK